MEEGPSVLQRKAIGIMLKTITKDNPHAWGNWLFECLEDWNLLPDASLPPSEYFYTLAELPPHPKRILVQLIIMGWNEHHDMMALYNGITTLIYLKVCGPSEYFFMHQVYNFMEYFWSVSGDDKKIFIQMHNLNKYTLRFTKDGDMMGESLAIVDLEMSRTTEDPMLAISPWFYSFDNKNGLPLGTKQTEPTQSFVDNEVMPIICNEFAKNHCPWIYANSSVSFTLAPSGLAPIIFLSNIEYHNDFLRV